MKKCLGLLILLIFVFAANVTFAYADDYSPESIKAKINELIEKRISPELEQLEKKDKFIIAVSDVNTASARGVEKNLCGFIESQLIESFHQSEKFTVVDRTSFGKVVAELNLQLSGIVDPQTAKQIGKQLGADIMIVPSLSIVGYAVELEVKAVDVEKGVIVSIGSIQIIDRLQPELKDAELNRLQKTASTIDTAVEILADGIYQNNIYIYPLASKNSREVTQFAGILKDKLADKLRTTPEQESAAFYLSGTYQINDDFLEIVYNFMDKDYKLLDTRVVKLLAIAYAGLQVQPQGYFQLDDSYISSDFRAEIKTNRGDRNLIFKAGEVIELFARLNRPGYYYLIGHSKKESQEFSYLLPLDDEGMDASKKFVGYVNDEMVNKWISLGSFKVEAPFGLEAVQLIASKSVFAELPGYSFDNKEGYYVISNDIKNTLATRGLKVVKKEKEKDTAEALLVMTTVKE